MTPRRKFMKFGLGAELSLAMPHASLLAATRQQLLTRAIPSSGERLPVIGLGSSATFSQRAGEGADALREVLRTLLVEGGKVFDTAPG